MQDPTIRYVMLSGGQVLGKRWPSEAMCMYSYIISKKCNPSSKTIMLDEESLTTLGNARAIIEANKLATIKLPPMANVDTPTWVMA